MCISTLPRDVGSVTTAGSLTSKVWPQGAVSTGNVHGFGESTCIKVFFAEKRGKSILCPCLLQFQNSAKCNVHININDLPTKLKNLAH